MNRGHLCHLPVAALCVRYEGCLQPTLKAAVSWSGGKEVWLGLPLTEETVSRMEASGLDPCVEFGESHTMVTNCPRFSSPVRVVARECPTR